MMNYHHKKLKSEGGRAGEVKYEDYIPDWIFNDTYKIFQNQQFGQELVVFKKKGYIEKCKHVPWGLMKQLNRGMNVIAATTSGNKCKIGRTSLYYNHSIHRLTLKSPVEVMPFGGSVWVPRNRPRLRIKNKNGELVDEGTIKQEQKQAQG